MDTKLTINQLGKLVGISTKAIRYYEEIGLITPTRRAENGYRMYDNTYAEELKLIKYARDLGLPIEEIKKLMKGCEDKDCNHTRTFVKAEIDSYINLLDEKIKQMQLLRTKLISLRNNIAKEKQNDCEYCCDVLGQLSKDKRGGER